MALVVPNNGEGDLLTYGLNKSAAENVVLRLYQSNTTPAETDTAVTYTEATWTGYAAITLTGASWAVAEGAPSEASYAQQTFTSSAGAQNQNNYGYYMTRLTSGRIAWAERFPSGPYTIIDNGDNIKVTPKFTAD